MASPSVVGTPTETAISTAGTSHVVNLPSGATGNLFIAIMDKGSTAATVGALAGWNELLDENSANGLYIAWRACDGTEGATTTFTLSASTRGAWIVYEISGAADPTVRPPEIGTTATGSSTTPDPPSVSVTGGTRDVLTIACFGRSGEEADDDTWVTAAPSGFGGLLQKACGTVGTNLGGMVATAHLASTTATSDPATFTCATGAWRAQTIVVHPDPTETAVAEVSLASGSTPTSRTLHSIKVRARVTSGAGTIRAAVYEGANNRSGDLESSALTTSLADYTLSIADASAANITDYSNLSIRFWGYSANGGSIVFEVDQLWLQIPEAAAAAYSLDCQPGSFTVAGTAATLAAARLFDAQPSSYTVTGAAATVVAGRAIDAASGLYSVTGSDATVLPARAILADPGAYTVTGAAATVAAGLLFDAQPGAYSVTGSAATIVPGYATLSDPGSYAVTGADADLVYTPVGAFSLNAEPGSFAVTGSDAQLLYGALLSIDAQPGSFAVTGSDATLAAGIVLDVQPGSFAVTGSDASVVADRALSADPGDYAVTAEDIATPISYSLDAQPGTYAVTGADADLVLAVPGAYVLNAETGVLTVTGANATTLATREVNAATGSYALTGNAATLFLERMIGANAGTFTVTGNDATIFADRALDAAASTFVVTGVSASIGSIFDYELDATAGNVTVSGAAANLFFEPGLARLTTRGGRIRWNTTGSFRGENRAGRITQNKEGAVA
jgi:hypothetical protein